MHLLLDRRRVIRRYKIIKEFFEKLRSEPERWGKPFQALLGALEAQLGLDAAAIGGKDSMSGTFLDKDVPPTVISFAIAPVKADEVISNEFKEAGQPVWHLQPDRLRRLEKQLEQVPCTVPGGQGQGSLGCGRRRYCRSGDENVLW